MEGNGRSPDERFAEWYVWAKREITGDIRACLGAAQAAMEALDQGRDEDAARLAARASTAGLSHSLASQVPARRRAYAEWYDWARREIRGDSARLHTATRTAMAHLDGGGDAGQAAQLARTAVGTLPEPPTAEPPARSIPTAEPPAAAMPTQPYQPVMPPAAAPETAAVSPYASFWRRLVAFLIDVVISVVGGYAVGLLIVVFAFISVFASGQTLSEDKLTGITIGEILFVIVLQWLYYAGLESSTWRATIGKRIMKLAVADVDGRPISFARATGRYFAKILSVLTLFIGFVIAAFTPRRQALHDLIAGTTVCRRELLPALAERRTAAPRAEPPPVPAGPPAPGTHERAPS